MTLLDPTGQLEILSSSDDHVVVRLPLSVSSTRWMPEFMALARAKDLAADVHGVLLTVKVPVAASREETAQLLDGVLRLIDEAQAQADTRLAAATATEQHIRDWWESRKRPSQGNGAPE